MAQRISSVQTLTTPAAISLAGVFEQGRVMFFFAGHGSDIELCQEAGDSEGLLIESGGQVSSGPWNVATAPLFLRAAEETEVRVTVVRL